MEQYVNISIDFKPIINREFDLRIPSSMTLKEIVQIVSDSYDLGLDVINPNARIMQTGKMLFSTSKFEEISNGMLVQLESI